MVLEDVFNKTSAEAHDIMMKVHEKESGFVVCIVLKSQRPKRKK